MSTEYNLLKDTLTSNLVDYDKIKNDDIIILESPNQLYDISFIIPVRGRLNFAKPMLKSFSEASQKSGLKISLTFVEYSNLPEYSQFCKKNKLNYIWIKSEVGQPFNKSLAMNTAAIYGPNSKYVLFHDLDCLIQSDFFIKLMENVNKKNCQAIQCFHGRRVLYLNEELTQSVISDKISVDELKFGFEGVTPPHIIGAPGGSICVDRELFFKIGGYDAELFHANAPEDIFFWNKLEVYGQVETCNSPEIDIFHMNHPVTYYDNPSIQEMQILHKAFQTASAEEKNEYLTIKKETIARFFKKERRNVRLIDKQFAHGKSFGTGDLQISPVNFEWHRGDKIDEIVFLSEDSFADVDLYTEKNKVGFIIESPSIRPEIYEFIKTPENYNKFTTILTFDNNLIKLNPDKFKFLAFGGCWIYPEDRKIYDKSKNISIIASSKTITSGHRLRHDVVERFKDKIEGMYGGGYQFVQNKLEALKDFRYSFVIEQANHDAMFSEKLIDCLVTGTIPIYWGCEGTIKNYFNIDGILEFNNLDELPAILEKCTEEYYNEHIEAIKDNFERAKKYVIPEDYIWENYLKNL